ncbi:hypothetical protein ABIC83_002573 [Roseateles asaccharophilus]|uniref:hypothetical protein n=1 Tax=Roseateles asaccharophilus TaxID=582607 RepID=UPI003834574C
MKIHLGLSFSAAALLLAASAIAQPSASLPTPFAGEAGLSTLRGFKIGSPCMALGDAYLALRKEGFKLPSVQQACNVNAADFRSDYLLQENDDRQELIELHFTPESTLWRSKVTWTWKGAARLSLRPTPEQVVASLRARFGKPFVETTDGSLNDGTPAGTHSAALAWSTTAPNAGPDITPADGFTWSRWTASLTGTVTKALVRWSDSSRRVDLVVEMTDQAVLPAAVKAQEAARAAKDAAWARQDSRILRGL